MTDFFKEFEELDPEWDRARLRGGEVETRHCKRCGSPFTVLKSQTGTYCSRECWTFKPVKQCEVCGREFQCNANEEETRRTCSRECAAKNAQKIISKTCPECGVTKSGPTSELLQAFSGDYCSRKCGAAHRRKRIVKRCEVCSGEYEVLAKNAAASRFCSNACKNQFARTTPFCRNGHPYTEENTGRARDGSQRWCRTCKREASRARKRAKRTSDP